MKLLVEEPQSDALAQHLRSLEGELRLVASWLLHTELYCAANRHPSVVDADSVAVLLDTVTLVDLARGDLLTAGALPGPLRSQDAIHLAVSLRLGADLDDHLRRRAGRSDLQQWDRGRAACLIAAVALLSAASLLAEDVDLYRVGPRSSAFHPRLRRLI